MGASAGGKATGKAALESAEMSDDTVPDWASEAARARGPVPSGCYRVCVLDASGDLSVQDFADRQAAQQFANDAASEDHPSPLAYVFDDRLHFVARGRHYAGR